MNKSNVALLKAYESGYRVLEDGTFVSPNGCVLKTKLIRGRYKAYTIKISTTEKSHIMIHRLCAYQIYGDKLFEAECVRHLNGDSLDNSWMNIAIGTYKENSQDVPKEKRQWIGENASKYTIKWDREEIENFYKKHSGKETRKHFGISPSSLWRVLNRKTNNKKI